MADSVVVAAAVVRRVVAHRPTHRWPVYVSVVARRRQLTAGEVALLVDGLTKLYKINFANREDRQAGSFRKMVVAMAQDLRVILIKLCDRFDNMRSLGHVEQERRQEGPIRLLMGLMRGPVIEMFSVDALLPLSFDSSHLPGARKKRA